MLTVEVLNIFSVIFTDVVTDSTAYRSKEINDSNDDGKETQPSDSGIDLTGRQRPGVFTDPLLQMIQVNAFDL